MVRLAKQGDGRTVAVTPASAYVCASAGDDARSTVYSVELQGSIDGHAGAQQVQQHGRIQTPPKTRQSPEPSNHCCRHCRFSPFPTDWPARRIQRQIRGCILTRRSLLPRELLQHVVQTIFQLDNTEYVNEMVGPALATSGLAVRVLSR